MSKSLGNALDPFELLDRYGADPLRWFMLAGGSPWVSRRLAPEVLEDVTRSFFLTLWNTYGFCMLYGRLAGFDPTAPATARPTALDRWALAELADTVTEVTERLEAYDPAAAGRRLTSFVEDLSNWYVRLSRRRFWRGAGEDSEAAFRTLWTCLRTLALLLAPYTPFVAEQMWQGLAVAVEPGAPDSVHLADWPVADQAAADEELRAAMAEVRRLVGLGRQARTEARVKVRQPLARALVTVPAERRDAVAELAPRLQRGERVDLDVPGLGRVELGPQEVGVVEEPVTGWRVVREGGASVALDLTITPELRLEGLARELVRAVQDLRKEAGLKVSDRIELAIDADGEVAEAVRAHGDYLRGETLAVALHRAPQGDGFEASFELDGTPVRLWLRPVDAG